jgi:Protein of unknown function (DUF4058)
MPSPFPGMDPFVEAQRWSTFHHSILEVIAEVLVLDVRPRYVIDIEERVYLEHAPEEAPPFLVPDVAVAETRGEVTTATAARGVGTLAAVTPVTLPLPMPDRRREPYLTIRDRATRKVVTVIEVLSRTNKRAGSDGRDEYLRKRETVFLSDAHLVELDLLRGGERLPMRRPLPPADYYAIVSREAQRPMAEVYPWSLRQPLPPFPVPLAGDDRDVVLDLQRLFTAVYDRGGYDYALDYQAAVEPPLSEVDAVWVRECLSVGLH